jgi:hypothetical protein
MQSDETTSAQANSRSGRRSPTTLARAKNSRTITIQTPYGPIGITVPASFPQIDVIDLPDGVKLSILGSCSTVAGRS